MKLQEKGFTLVELIVVITILAILATIGYLSLVGYAVVARDTTRLSDIKNITKVVELFKLEQGVYPPVTNAIDVSFSGAVIWKQGSFGNETRSFAKRISEVPVDPLTGNEYAYSITQSTGEYQLGAILETDPNLSFVSPGMSKSYASVSEILQSFASAVTYGNYNGKFITHIENDHLYVLGVPSILSNEITDVTLQEIYSNSSFVYAGGSAAPATYSGAVQDQGDWNFSPTNTSGDINVIYSGSVSTINTGSGKIDLMSNIKSYYENTAVATSNDYKVFSQIDPASSPNEAIELANTYISTGVGGLGNGAVLLTEVSSGGSSGSTPSSSPASVYCGSTYSATYNGYGGLFNADTYPNISAYAGLKNDGSIVAWGNFSDGGGGEPGDSGYTKIYSNAFAFSALKDDGSIKSWGNSSFGGTGEPTGTGFVKIYATRTDFAALKDDGSITAWGAYAGTGEPIGTGYTQIASNERAFAALASDGSISVWGDAGYGGSSAPAGTGYTKIYSTQRAFAALASDGSISVWGDSGYGGSSAPAGTGYTKIYSTQRAFAALANDGSISVWGEPWYGGNSAPVGTGYTEIYPNTSAFAALANDGSIAVWGDASSGGSNPPAGTGYTKIYATTSAFAALASDGSIAVWGNSNAGGSGAPAGSGYTKIYNTLLAFAALAGDGSVKVWGNDNFGGRSINEPSGTGYTEVFSNSNSFVVIEPDTSLYIWGGSSSLVDFHTTGTGFVSINGGNACE